MSDLRPTRRPSLSWEGPPAYAMGDPMPANPPLKKPAYLLNRELSWLAFNDRVLGEAKGVWSLWVSAHQRSLHFEAYFTPPPERNAERFYEHLLRRNRSTDDVAFCIGDEDAVFLRSKLSLEHVSHDELDRTLGSFYGAVEDAFGTAVRLSFAKDG